MSAAAPAVPHTGSFALRRTQLLTILRAELSRNFITKRGFWIYLLAFAPAVIVWIHSWVTMTRGLRGSHDLAKDTQVLSVMFQIFFLRPGVFFGCVGIFTYLFRGEFVERSLHYYFLAPVRREVLVVAKYLAGCITAIAFFGGSFLLTFTGMYAHFPQFEVRQFMTAGTGLQQLTTYLGVTVLAIIAWGAVFLWMGIRFRNPIIPAVIFFVWETANAFFPSWLRRFGVLHFLQSLVPFGGETSGPAAVIGTTVEPESAAVAVIGLLLIAAAMVALSLYQIRRTEISYSTD